MPTTKNPDTDIKERKNSLFAVVADAVVVPSGKKADGSDHHRRVNRGGVVRGSADNRKIRFLLSRKAIREVSSEKEARQILTSGERRTVRESASLQGAPDDPVKPPQADAQPADLSTGDQSPFPQEDAQQDSVASETPSDEF